MVLKIPIGTARLNIQNESGSDYLSRHYSGVYLKRCSHSSFNSYVVGMERETIVLHSELSLKIRSRARHMVNSWKKERDDGLEIRHSRWPSWCAVLFEKSDVQKKMWSGQRSARGLLDKPTNRPVIIYIRIFMYESYDREKS